MRKPCLIFKGNACHTFGGIDPELLDSQESDMSPKIRRWTESSSRAKRRSFHFKKKISNCSSKQTCRDYFILSSLREEKGATLQSPKTPLPTLPFIVNKFVSKFSLYPGNPPGSCILDVVASHSPPNSSLSAWQPSHTGGYQDPNLENVNCCASRSQLSITTI